MFSHYAGSPILYNDKFYKLEVNVHTNCIKLIDDDKQILINESDFDKLKLVLFRLEDITEEHLDKIDEFYQELKTECFIEYDFEKKLEIFLSWYSENEVVLGLKPFISEINFLQDNGYALSNIPTDWYITQYELNKSYKLHMTNVLTEMCTRVGANFNRINFKKSDWYWEFEWTQSEDDNFIEWLSDYLFKYSGARTEIMQFPVKNKIICKGVASQFCANYSWRITDNILSVKG